MDREPVFAPCCGLAACHPRAHDTGRAFLAYFPASTSSTQCELLALTLLSRFSIRPPRVLTDSLCSLQLLRSWGRRPMAAILSCQERAEVRTFIYQWQGSSSAPLLEKVQAHDTDACRAGCPKALGNAMADARAKDAALSLGSSLYVPDPRAADAVQLQDNSGVWIRDVRAALTSFCWEERRAAVSSRRPWLATLFPAGLTFDWTASVYIFRCPLVVEGKFVHNNVDSPVLKWVARARSGALVSSDRYARTRNQPLLWSPRGG